MLYQDKPPVNEVYKAMILESESDLEHYGTPRRSGRYPWGSGENPYQHTNDFLGRVQEMRDKNFTYTDPDTGKTYSGDTAIAKSMGLSTGQFRTQLGLANAERRQLMVETAKGLKEKGYSATEGARIMGLPGESSFRSLLKQDSEIRMKEARKTADILKKAVDEKGFIDVGKGVEKELGVSKEKMNQALEILRLEGYPTYGGRMPQVTNSKQKTTIQVLCPPGTEHKEIFEDYGNIHSVNEYVSRDDGQTFHKKFTYPSSMDSKRLQIRYAEDGGINRDGLIELRRGVPDLDLGNDRYAQVRILVDGNRYLKGMAVYSDDLPDGIDVRFNTNKTKDISKMDVLKKISSDPDNPFGSTIKDSELGGQYWYKDPKTGKDKLGLINKRANEGDWSDWSNKLPSQFLSKQSEQLAKRQLNLALKDKNDEYNDILVLNNPTVKKKFLEDFADGCDSAAVHLYAAALPRQQYHVILPFESIKDNEVFAPNYKDGEKVALIRYPHGGTFEIPILTVNNKLKEPLKTLGNDVGDAIGINKHVADRLSGADFDGDTVMVIPTNSKVRINSTKALSKLEGFDPKITYGTRAEKNPNYTGKKGEEEFFYYNSDGIRVKPMKNTQNEMGRISNLITDMNLRGANEDELARAVKHSMVVIDAEKHHLDYRKSYIDNDIDTLKKTYQEGGASTLISKAKNEKEVPKRQGNPRINIKGSKDYNPDIPEGALIYKTADDLYKPIKTKNNKTGIITLKTTDGKRVKYDPNDEKQREEFAPVKRKNPETGETFYTNRKGNLTYALEMRTEPTTQMADTYDARTLISKMNTPMERLYADYANSLKAMANRARKEMVTTAKIPYSKKANEIYSNEVSSLKKKLTDAELNKPRERQAQAIANSRVSSKIKSNPDITKEEEKKLRQQELTRAREQVGAKRNNIKITDREWEAIQAGAIGETVLKNIMDNSDLDVLRERATPRNTKTLTPAQISRINSMQKNGLTIQQIANALGVSTSTISRQLRGRK